MNQNPTVRCLNVWSSDKSKVQNSQLDMGMGASYLFSSSLFCTQWEKTCSKNFPFLAPSFTHSSPAGHEWRSWPSPAPCLLEGRKWGKWILPCLFLGMAGAGVIFRFPDLECETSRIGTKRDKQIHTFLSLVQIRFLHQGVGIRLALPWANSLAVSNSKWHFGITLSQLLQFCHHQRAVKNIKVKNKSNVLDRL